MIYRGSILSSLLLNNKKYNTMFGLGTREIIILAGILVLLFGSKKIADLARGVAEAVKILKGSFSDGEKKDTTDKNK